MDAFDTKAIEACVQWTRVIGPAPAPHPILHWIDEARRGNTYSVIAAQGRDPWAWESEHSKRTRGRDFNVIRETCAPPTSSATRGAAPPQRKPYELLGKAWGVKR